jgi:long-chain fatty acid transport protein
MLARFRLAALCASLAAALCSRAALAQSFGVESHNTMMPASGGLGGTSLARPQDLMSAINGNPGTLTQFKGTQFLFGGSWAEPTYNLAQSEPIPLLGVEPFGGKSTAQGIGTASIGVTQDLSMLGLPATFGIGLLADAAGGADFRHIPASNGTNTALSVLEITSTLGFDLTERLSVGAGVSLGTAFFDAPFVEIGGMTYDYALRGVIGADYDVTEYTNVGVYYQTEQGFTFDNAVQFDRGPLAASYDLSMDLPQNVGFGVANNRLMQGRLLLMADVLYKLYEDAAMFSAVYDNQWVFQTGAQYTRGRYKYRLGYAYAQDPLSDNPGPNIGGITPPGGFPSVRYTQGLLAITSPHRISGGLGVSDVLPGIDFDFMAGGMFRDESQLGPSTTSSIESYWLGAGLTWSYDRCRKAKAACCE